MFRLQPTRHFWQHSWHENHHPAHHLRHLHDLCLVWSLEVPQSAAFQSDHDQLGIAFFEYCFQVPANRIGSYEFSVAQLKTIQE
jgi:hypothetical protein